MENVDFVYNVGDVCKLKLTDEKVMILKQIPVSLTYGVQESGYLVRLSNGLQEVFVRQMEVG